MIHAQIVSILTTLLASLGGVSWSPFGRLLEALADIGESSTDLNVRAAARGIVHVLSVAEDRGTFHMIDAFQPQDTAMPESGILDYRIVGHVQSVGYRFYLQAIGNSLGLHGYVKNLPDGSVRAVVYPPADPQSLLTFSTALLAGPSGASVTSVDSKVL